MKFTIESELFSGLLSAVSICAEKKSTIPILSCVKITARDNRLILETNDTEKTISLWTSLPIQKSGSLCVNISSIQRWSALLPEGSDIECRENPNGNGLIFSSGRSKNSISIFPAADFPVFKSPECAQSALISAPLFKTLLDEVSFCMASEEVRRYLCGIYIKQSPTQIDAFATDGHKMARSFMDSVERFVPENGVMIPREIRRSLDGVFSVCESPLSVTTDGNIFSLSWNRDDNTGGGEFRFRLADETAPNWHRVAPTTAMVRVLVSRADLALAIKRASCVMDEKNRGLAFSITKSTIHISQNIPGITSSIDEIVSCGCDGEIRLVMNYKNLIEALEHLATDFIEIGVNDPELPIILRESSGQGFTDIDLEKRFIVTDTMRG